MAIAQANEEPKSLGSRALAWPGQVRDYIDDLRMEMRKVSWPSTQQVRDTTLVVIIAVFAFAAYFFVVDSVVNATVTRLFDTLTK